MDKVNKIKIDRLIHTLGLKYNLSDETIRNMVNSQFEFTAEKLNEVKLEEDSDTENIKSTFLYRSFGKLYLNKTTLINYLNKRKNGRNSKCNREGSTEVN